MRFYAHGSSPTPEDSSCIVIQSFISHLALEGFHPFQDVYSEPEPPYLFEN